MIIRYENFVAQATFFYCILQPLTDRCETPVVRMQ